jgi:hypothetical protein
METIIKKAIEGGWKPRYRETPSFLSKIEGIEQEDREELLLSSAVLDPLFWQALCKACGWGNETIDDYDTGLVRGRDWQHHALRFHEINLTESWDKAVEYLRGITN